MEAGKRCRRWHTARSSSECMGCLETLRISTRSTRPRDRDLGLVPHRGRPLGRRRFGVASYGCSGSEDPERHSFLAERSDLARRRSAESEKAINLPAVDCGARTLALSIGCRPLRTRPSRGTRHTVRRSAGAPPRWAVVVMSNAYAADGDACGAISCSRNPTRNRGRRRQAGRSCQRQGRVRHRRWRHKVRPCPHSTPIRCRSARMPAGRCSRLVCRTCAPRARLS